MEEKENTVWNLINDLGSKRGITEVVINDPKRVFVEREGQFIQLNVQLSKNDLYSFAKEVAHFNKKEFNAENPILDGNLPDGSRVNIISEPYSQGSPAVTIRKYLKTIKSFDDDDFIFGLNKRWIEFFKSMVASRCNIIVSGGTGVGKTTFINLLLKEMSPAERVIIIEDTKELSLSSPNVVRLEVFAASKDHSGLSARDLVKNTLRMRPDRIIVGEVRGGELFDLLQAMNTGHDGSMSSIHSNSPGECISRMENLFLMSGFDVPFQVVRKQITQGVDFIIQLGRNREGQRVVNQIMEITGMEGPNILSQQLALRDDDGLIGTGISPKNMSKLHRDGGLPQDFFNQ
jgi:pilus assembly protein CpaF